MADPNRPWKSAPIPTTTDVLEAAHVCTDDGYPTIGEQAEEILRLRDFVRSIYFEGTTGEDSNDFITGTTDSCGKEIRSWGEDPDEPARAFWEKRERAEAERRERHELEQLEALRKKYPEA